MKKRFYIVVVIDRDHPAIRGEWNTRLFNTKRASVNYAKRLHKMNPALDVSVHYPAIGGERVY